MQWFNAVAEFPKQQHQVFPNYGETGPDPTDQLMGDLKPYSPTVGMNPEDHPVARISLQANNLQEAETKAVTVIAEAFAKAGVKGNPQVRVQTEEDFLRAEGYSN